MIQNWKDVHCASLFDVQFLVTKLLTSMQFVTFSYLHSIVDSCEQIMFLLRKLKALNCQNFYEPKLLTKVLALIVNW